MFSIVIPAYNEGSKIAVTIFDIQKVLKINKLEEAEIIVVDDGSTDRTVEMSSKTGTLAVSHPHNAGYGRSLKDGIRAATNDTIIIMDADGAYPAEMIPVLLNEFEKGYDMVTGARDEVMIQGSYKKRLLRSVLKKLTEFSTGKKIPDINSGFRVFSRKGIMPLFQRLNDTVSFNSSLTLSYIKEGKFIKYIPVDIKINTEKENPKAGLKFFSTLTEFTGEVLYYDPMKIFFLFSVSLLLITVFCFTSALITKWLLFSYVGLGCILLSLLFIGIGLFAMQLKSIFATVNNEK